LVRSGVSRLELVIQEYACLAAVAALASRRIFQEFEEPRIVFVILEGVE
jgi:hypothetical protein